ncbi:MAG: Mur ligase family protein [Bacteroidetes bacterium]|nr:Mur ligase family protein [Bacteroidota bacterium]
MKYHFIAIGGSAMHNLALALHHSGHQVSGSDDAIFEPSKSRLASAGILPLTEGWDVDKIDSTIDFVVLGMHAKANNPELLRALQLGLEVISYPELIYRQSEHKTRVVIAGSHGKTTITSMILHVMNYFGKSVDYLVGAQLEGFDRMVRLSDDADFIIIEGDEYLSSALDPRPKFLWYQPNIALISGVAWDHINVFKTEDSYNKQFSAFIESIIPGGSLTFNATDTVLGELVHSSTSAIRKFPYETPAHEIVDGITYLDTDEGPIPLRIFGDHNLINLEGARWICQQLGVDMYDFYEAISTFSGAAKRMQLISYGNGFWIKDFAHAPSKVKATTAAVKKQFANKPLLAVLELHTYSSLNPEFIPQYNGVLDPADAAIVFYDPKALQIKGLPPLSAESIKLAFGRSDLKVYTDAQLLEVAVKEAFSMADTTQLLFMSSGNYGGIDLTPYGG